MPITEIVGTIGSVRASLDIAKAMIGLRDAEVMRTTSIDLKNAILDSLDQAIAAREAQSTQLDLIRTLEAKIARLEKWDAEKERYELVPVGRGAMAFMLKPEARGAEPPHWLCPDCFSNGKQSFFQPFTHDSHVVRTYHCGTCKAQISVDTHERPEWQERPTVQPHLAALR